MTVDHPLNRAPRIIRTAAHVWGLPSLALKELAQVMTGNELLTFTPLMASLMIRTGGFGVVEHLAEHGEASAAAIWKLPAVLSLLQAPGVEKRRLAQSLFGAASATRSIHREAQIYMAQHRTAVWVGKQNSDSQVAPQFQQVAARFEAELPDGLGCESLFSSACGRDGKYGMAGQLCRKWCNCFAKKFSLSRRLLPQKSLLSIENFEVKACLDWKGSAWRFLISFVCKSFYEKARIFCAFLWTQFLKFGPIGGCLRAFNFGPRFGSKCGSLFGFNFGSISHPSL